MFLYLITIIALISTFRRSMAQQGSDRICKKLNDPNFLPEIIESFSENKAETIPLALSKLNQQDTSKNDQLVFDSLSKFQIENFGENWKLHGAASRNSDGRVFLNPANADHEFGWDVSGYLVSNLPIPIQSDSNWRLDVSMDIHVGESRPGYKKQGAHIGIYLADEDHVRNLSAPNRSTFDSVINWVTEEHTQISQQKLWRIFTRAYIDDTFVVGLIPEADSCLMSENKSREPTGVSETFHFHIQRNDDNISMASEWYSGNGQSYRSFSQLPMASMLTKVGPLYLVATAPSKFSSLKLANSDGAEFDIIEVTAMSFAPIFRISTSALAEGQNRPVLPKQVNFSNSTDLDCSAEVSSFSPVVSLWFRQFSDGLIERIEGTDQKLMLRNSKEVFGNAEAIICLIRNRYGISKRMFLKKDAGHHSSSSDSSAVFNILIFVSGFLVGGAGVFLTCIFSKVWKSKKVNSPRRVPSMTDSGETLLPM